MLYIDKEILGLDKRTNKEEDSVITRNESLNF